MRQKHFWTLLFLAVILALALNILFGRFLSAKISTWPPLSRWHLVSPEAPIVITNKETVRVSDGSDLLDAANTAKSRLSAVVSVVGGKMTEVGGAVNIAPEGIFVTGNIFGVNASSSFVVLTDGTTAPVQQVTSDPVTGLVFFSAKTSNVPVSVLGVSQDLQTADKLLFLTNAAQSYQTESVISSVTETEGDVSQAVYDSDKPSRSFTAQDSQNFLPGTAVVNVRGEVVGVWNGSAIVSSDVLRQVMALYFSGNRSISRPSFGFTYTIVTKVQSQLQGLPEGAQVKTVSKGKAAAGILEESDVIVSVDGQNVNQDNPLEVLLQKYKTGDRLSMSVIRNKQTVNLTLKVQ